MYVRELVCVRACVSHQPLPSNSSMSSNCGEATAGKHATTVGVAEEVCFLTGCGSAAATLSGMGL